MRLVRTFHLTWEDPIDGAEYGEVEYELRKATGRDNKRPRTGATGSSAGHPSETALRPAGGTVA